MQNDSMVVPPRLPLVVLPSNRAESTNTDARLVNCYIETNEQGELNIYRRPGIRRFFQAPNGVKPGLGLYHWDGDVYAIFGEDFYRDYNDSGPIPEIQGDHQFTFSSILGATPKILFKDGEFAYTYNQVSGMSANLHDINTEFPEFTVPGWAYLNGAEYVMQEEAVIWGSVVNSVDQVGDWSALNFISAQADPDNGIALNKQLVYAIAFNQWTTEVFFDAGNPTGSPLGPVQGSIVSYGCANADSIQSIDDCLFWLCRNRTNSLQIAMMKQLNLEIASTKPIDRLIASADISNGNIFSWQTKAWGHSFYVITFKSLNLTLAYDVVENIWCQWTDSNGNYLPFVASTYDREGRTIIQHEAQGYLAYISPEYLQDTDLIDSIDYPIQMDIYTPTFDAQTRRRKQMNRMSFVADQSLGCTMLVRHTDDDYNTWSNWRQVDLGQKEPLLTNCGTFKKRAWHFRIVNALRIRLSAVEVQYDLGTL